MHITSGKGACQFIIEHLLHLGHLAKEAYLFSKLSNIEQRVFHKAHNILIGIESRAIVVLSLEARRFVPNLIRGS